MRTESSDTVFTGKPTKNNPNTQSKKSKRIKASLLGQIQSSHLNEQTNSKANENKPKKNKRSTIVRTESRDRVHTQAE